MPDRQMTGEPCHVRSHVLVVPLTFIFTLGTMAAHRASALLAILPVALQTGYSEVFPDHEPLKVSRQRHRSAATQTGNLSLSTRTS